MSLKMIGTLVVGSDATEDVQNNPTKMKLESV